MWKYFKIAIFVDYKKLKNTERLIYKLINWSMKEDETNWIEGRSHCAFLLSFLIYCRLHFFIDILWIVSEIIQQYLFVNQARPVNIEWKLCGLMRRGCWKRWTMILSCWWEIKSKIYLPRLLLSLNHSSKSDKNYSRNTKKSNCHFRLLFLQLPITLKEKNNFLTHYVIKNQKMKK